MIIVRNVIFVFFILSNGLSFVSAMDTAAKHLEGGDDQMDQFLDEILTVRYFNPQKLTLWVVENDPRFFFKIEEKVGSLVETVFVSLKQSNFKRCEVVAAKIKFMKGLTELSNAEGLTELSNTMKRK